MDTTILAVVRSPDRPSAEMPSLGGSSLVVPEVVIPVVTPEHFTPTAAALHIAQGIVTRVFSKVSPPQTLDDATLLQVCEDALKAQFGEGSCEGAPTLTGPRQTSWQLVQVAEHLVRRQVESAVIESAIEGALL